MFQRNALSGHKLAASGAVVALAMFSAPLAEAASTAVREPRWGIPHIYGETDLELNYETGRQVAQIAWCS